MRKEALTRSERNDGEQPQAPSRPLVRWAGSKRQLLPILASYWGPSFERYIEPFCGSSALFYELQPDCAILSDSNAELIAFYQLIKSDPVRVWKAVSRLPRTREQYNSLRALDSRTLQPFQRAVRFLFLNRNCFNGLYRTNLAGDFNVPFSASRTGDLPPLSTFLDSARTLGGATVRCCDFGQALRSVRRGDFVYLDPPFFVTTRRIFRHYGPRGFHERDMSRLSTHLAKLDKKGAHFVMTLADSKEARAIGQAWSIRRVRVRRQIAGFAAGRRQAYEVIITNLNCSEGYDDH